MEAQEKSWRGGPEWGRGAGYLVARWARWARWALPAEYRVLVARQARHARHTFSFSLRLRRQGESRVVARRGGVVLRRGDEHRAGERVH